MRARLDGHRSERAVGRRAARGAGSCGRGGRRGVPGDAGKRRDPSGRRTRRGVRRRSGTHDRGDRAGTWPMRPSGSEICARPRASARRSRRPCLRTPRAPPDIDEVASALYHARIQKYKSMGLGGRRAHRGDGSAEPRVRMLLNGGTLKRRTPLPEGRSRSCSSRPCHAPSTRRGVFFAGAGADRFTVYVKRRPRVAAAARRVRRAGDSEFRARRPRWYRPRAEQTTGGARRGTTSNERSCSSLTTPRPRSFRARRVARIITWASRLLR